MTRDAIGDRMKGDYERRTQAHLPRRTYTIIRVDGRSFHRYTRDCERPFDAGLMEGMDQTALALCDGIEGAQIAYVQSDEISVLLTDFGNQETQAWFDGNLQKIVSISASLATAVFNRRRMWRRLRDDRGTIEHVRLNELLCDLRGETIAQFDSRAFTIPQRGEVWNYFHWRQLDATRNSLQMLAHAHFSHKELHGKNASQLQEMLFQERAINWNNLPDGCKRGRCVVRNVVKGPVTYTDKRTGEEKTLPEVERRVWDVVAPPVFSQDREWLMQRIPINA